MALADDYLKFIRISQEMLRGSGYGVWGMITNHGYLRGVIHQGVRRELQNQFHSVFIMDLHGDSNVGETPPSDRANENVFDIQQGVAIAVCAATGSGDSPKHVWHAECWGSREEKYDLLMTKNLASAGWTELRPRDPELLLIPFDDTNLDEYRAFPLLTELMPVNSCGIKTHRDRFLIDYDRKDLVNRFKDVASEPDPAKLKMRYAVKDTPHWKLEEAQAKIAASDVTNHIRPITYRPFDNRWIYYNPAIIEKGDSKHPTLRHMLHENKALLASRIQAAGACNAVFVSRFLAEMKTAEATRSCTVFPLYLADGDIRSSQRGLDIGDPQPNLDREVLRSIALVLGLETEKRDDFSKEFCNGIFDYAYAVFYSPGYRSRYAEFLRSDFPRLPLPSNLDLFRDLSLLGGELIALHLMESQKLDSLITTYTSPRNPEVGRVGWSNETVWLNAGKTNARQGQRATKPGTIGFHGVPEAVWDFHIGGYQVCHKWLKDRRGRTLSDDDITHYQKIVVALNETIRLMQEIDEVIEQHGGWPGAFVTSKEASDR